MEEIKLSLLAYDVIVYVENIKESKESNNTSKI